MVTGSFVSQALSINWSLFSQTERGAPGEEMSPQHARTSRTAAVSVLGALGSSEVYSSSEMAEEDALLWSDPFPTYLFLPSGVPGTGWLSHPKAPLCGHMLHKFQAKSHNKIKEALSWKMLLEKRGKPSSFLEGPLAASIWNILPVVGDWPL